MSKNIKILVAAHKSYWMPAEDVYMPIHVGAEGKKSIGFIGDNTGNHISHKNPNYCELTGLYWFWKNEKADYVGLAVISSGLGLVAACWFATGLLGITMVDVHAVWHNVINIMTEMSEKSSPEWPMVIT